MEDGKPDETDTEGEEANTPVENNKKDTSELNKLKTSNDEFEKELIRGRELKAESQKLEAEKMLGGKSEAGQEPKKPEPVSNKDYAKQVEKGEANPFKEDGFD